MTPEELKSALAGEMATLKESFKHFVKIEDMQKEIENLKKTIGDNNVKGLEEQLGTLQKAAEEQGLALRQITEKGGTKEKTFAEILAEKAADIAAISKDKSVIINTSRKAITAASYTDNTEAFRESGMGEISRGMPWVRDLVNVVTLGTNTHGDIRWWEQEAITNNGAAVAELGKPANQSVISWIEKSLGGKRIKDFIKVSKDQIKDVAFVAGEVRTLLDRNIRLLENSALLSGDGNGNNIKGLLTYAPTFDPTGISIKNATIIDLIAKARTQIQTLSLDKYLPNTLVQNPNQGDLIRLAKNADGDYLYPNWAIGAQVSIGGLRMVENSLVADNTMLLGDFSVATLFQWDGITIEMGQIDDDFLTGAVTIMAYVRENLRVKATDVKGLLKITDVTAAVEDIKEQIA